MKQLLLIFLLAFTCSAYAINPEREYRWTPDKIGLNYSEYQVQTPDNYSINVWEYSRPDSIESDRTIILVGTDAGNMGYLVWQAEVFAKKGFRVISFDYRGFGSSSDFPIENDFLFHKEFAVDLDTVIRTTKEKFPSDIIGLYALSMGTHVSLRSNEKVEFLIAEGFYHDPLIVVERIKVNKDKTILLPEGAKPINHLEQRIPTLIFSASNDDITMTEDAKAFAKSNNVSIIEFEGDHLRGMNVFTKEEYGDEYSDKMIKFLQKNGI